MLADCTVFRILKVFSFGLDFDTTFSESQTKAEEALKTVEAIEEMVRDAVAKTTDAREAMQVRHKIFFMNIRIPKI